MPTPAMNQDIDKAALEKAALEYESHDGGEDSALNLDALRAAIRAYESARVPAPVGGWRDIDWTKPPKGNVILYWPEIIHPTRGRTHDELIRVDHTGATPYRKPTKWMPLPALPAPPESRKP